MEVPESVSGNQESIGFLRVPNKGGIECLIWIGEELIQLESAIWQRMISCIS